jgi:ribosomal RNA-processing protein 36
MRKKGYDLPKAARSNTGRSEALEGKKKVEKNAPIEISSKRRVGTFRNVVPNGKKRQIDPRFDDMSGQLNLSKWRKSFGFLQDVREEELHELEKQQKKVKGIDRKKELGKEIARKKQEIGAIRAREKEDDERAQWMKDEIAAVKEGKKPFYLKKGEQKKRMLLAKYQELDKVPGKLEKFLEKKRKKNASREHRYLPHKRREVS